MLPFTTDDVTIVHAELVEGYANNYIRDWANATRTTVRGLVQQTGTTETVQGGDQVAASFLVLLPPGTAVTSGDRVEWSGGPGRTLEVAGSPASYPGPAGHVEAQATEVRG